MATLPRAYSASSSSGPGNGSAAVAAAAMKHKKSKKISWTLGRKKGREEVYVEDGSGKIIETAVESSLDRMVSCMVWSCICFDQIIVFRFMTLAANQV